MVGALVLDGETYPAESTPVVAERTVSVVRLAVVTEPDGSVPAEVSALFELSGRSGLVVTADVRSDSSRSSGVVSAGTSGTGCVSSARCCAGSESTVCVTELSSGSRRSGPRFKKRTPANSAMPQTSTSAAATVSRMLLRRIHTSQRAVRFLCRCTSALRWSRRKTSVARSR